MPTNAVEPESNHAVPGAAEDLLRLAVTSLPLPLLITKDGSVVYSNPACADLLGAVTAEDASPRDLLRGLAADPRLLDALWSRHTALSGAESLEGHLPLRDGRQLRWISTRLEGSDGAVAHLLQELRPLLHRSTPAQPEETLFRLTFERAAVGMALLTPEYGFLRTNRSLCTMLGYAEGELSHRTILELALDPERARARWEEVLAAGREGFHFEEALRHRGGATVWADFSVSVVRDGDGRPIYFVALVEDVTRQKQHETERERRTRELQALASTDPLTGLYNYRFMREELDRDLESAREAGRPLSVLMLDVDGFRELNTRHGHDAGDRALKAVAECIREALRESDVACRYGGDEFLIILEGAPAAAALATAERVVSSVGRASQLAGLGEAITCSIGSATFRSHASAAASLLKAADMALYQAKSSGRDRIVGFEPALTRDRPAVLESLALGLRGAGPEAAAALVTSLDLRDRCSGAQAQQVRALADQLAERLECTRDERDLLRVAAPLLDIGKIALPDSLLTKTGHLTSEEWALMRQHPEWGESLVSHASLPEGVGQLVRWHHERLDGSGYPDGLQGEQIPLLVRILHVADVVAALQSNRPHRRAWPPPRIVEYLRRHADESLDARVVRAYLELAPPPDRA